jgi:hypothetical protein
MTLYAPGYYEDIRSEAAAAGRAVREALSFPCSPRAFDAQLQAIAGAVASTGRSNPAAQTHCRTCDRALCGCPDAKWSARA